MELQGKLYFKGEKVQKTETFAVREFVIEIFNTRNSNYNDYVKFQLSNDRCNLIDQFNVGDQVQVTFDINGRRWEKEGKVSYFNTLSAWRVGMSDSIPQQAGSIQKDGNQSIMQPLPPLKATEELPTDDLPF